jgi:hypothetical protein
MLLILVCFNAYGQTQQQQQSLQAFSRLYGYIRYFHPSDEASTINWDKFAAYGADQVLKCHSNQELKGVLNSLFSPIAPSVKILNANEDKRFSRAFLFPADTSGYLVVAWQHQGLGSPSRPDSPYKSQRTNRSGDEGLLFNRFSKVGDILKKDIGAGLQAYIPLALYGNYSSTYPASDTALLNALRQKLNVFEFSLDEPATRIASVIIAWNVFQHFYPYFDVIDLDWTTSFLPAVKGAYAASTSLDFLKVLRKLTAPLNDGHINVYGGIDFSDEETFTLPIEWEWVQDSLVITKTFADNLPVAVGDIVLRIDELSSKTYFERITTFVSGATPGWRTYRAQETSLYGKPNSRVALTVKNAEGKTKQISLQRNMSIGAYYTALAAMNTQASIQEIENGFFYINLTRASMKDIDQIMPDLKTAAVLICDMRGYPANNNHELIQHLLVNKDTSVSWMQVPQTIYPDRERLIGYKKAEWSMEPVAPHIKARVYFLLNPKAISYAESYMSFIEHYKLATIIGEPSAGTNGTVNLIDLPLNYHIAWTGMRVLKQNGTPLHGVGILPDVYMTKTIKGVRENRDEFLEKAIELAKTSGTPKK